MMHRHSVCSSADTTSINRMANSSPMSSSSQFANQNHTDTLMPNSFNQHRINNFYYSPMLGSKRSSPELTFNINQSSISDSQKYRMRRKRRNKKSLSTSSVGPHSLESAAFLAATTNVDLLSNITHSECIMKGFQALKSSRILCDVTLVAQDRRFDVHKVVLASCSDYFRSMFTGGMKESQQTVIELKAVSARGLEKLIEIIYTSCTHFESHIELFDVVSAANHLQCLVVIDFCERSFVKRINLDNFNLFIQMAQLYRMKNALRNIDMFIVNNLAELIDRTSSSHTILRDPSSEETSFVLNGEETHEFKLSYEQLLRCLVRNDLRIKEIDLFLLTWKWINNTVLVGRNTYKFQCNGNNSSRNSMMSKKNQTSLVFQRVPKKINLIRSLMKQIRFSLISPVDIVNKVQGINKIMTNDTFLRHLVLRALNYHVMPNLQSSLFRAYSNQQACRQSSDRSICSMSDSDSKSVEEDSDDNDEESYQFQQGIDSNRYSMNINIRSPIRSVLTIGGREINPAPCLHDKCYLVNDYITNSTTSSANSIEDRRIELASLPNALSHMQSVVVGTNFLYVMGGCTSQCAHGESAVSSVHRYDPRLNTWITVKPMQAKRAYFYACVLDVKSEANETISSDSVKSNTKQFIYAIGGKNREGALCSVERYDLTANSWEFVRSLPSAYYAHSGCVLDNIVYVTGGYSYGQFTADLYCYSPSIDQWQTLRPMNSPRGWHCMCVVNESLYVFGGCYLNNNMMPQVNGSVNVNPGNNNNTNGQHNNNVVSNGQQLIPHQHQQQQIAQPVLFTEFYSPKTDRWSLCRPMANLYKEASCFLLNSFIYVLGGYNIQAKTGQRIISRYDVVNDLWDTVGEQQLPAGVTGMGLVSIDVPWFMLESGSSLETSSLKSSQHKSALVHSNMMSNQFNFSYLYSDLMEEEVGTDSQANSPSSDSESEAYQDITPLSRASKSSFSCSSLEEAADNDCYELKKNCKFSRKEDKEVINAGVAMNL